MAGRGFKKEAKYFFIYHALRFVIWGACTASRKQGMRFFGGLSKKVFSFFPKEKEKMARHLSMAYGQEKSAQEIEKMAEAVMVNLGKNVVDIFRHRLTKNMEDYKKLVTINGQEHIEAALAKGKGVIFLTCHLGAFEMVGYFIQHTGYKGVGVGAALKDPKLNSLLSDSRKHEATEFIDKGENTIKLFRALKEGKVVLILIDQDTTKSKGVFVDFFGKKAYTPIGATMLAMRTGASVVPLAIHRKPDDFHQLDIKPAVELVDSGDKQTDLITNTQLLSDELETLIRQAPEQWVWMHERWKTRPPEEKKAAVGQGFPE